MLRHFNRVPVRFAILATKSRRLANRHAIEAATFAAKLTESGPHGGEPTGRNGPNNPVRPCPVPVCVSLSPALARRCVLRRIADICPERRTKSRPRSRPGRAMPRRHSSRSTNSPRRAVCWAVPRQSGMRLARPARGRSAVAGRSGHRFPSSRSLRPLRLPGGHIQATFRCVVRQGNIDPKATDTLNGRVHACWINPKARRRRATAAAPRGTTEPLICTIRSADGALSCTDVQNDCLDFRGTFLLLCCCFP